ncbi:hypothetical protein KQ910_12765 [Reyranella sp. MMS21-HV4-11]|uniref:Uncharacterized protein n=1 Tax=Reyranella humidisoli TaxID=2849149 RepID=A0ABS6IL49_9HYPH|nr:hypothetical protein [Reyranella sp. MMS21-HV4-11]MBU8874639.1 hypothetical protein [Reyranella sp. MMS21-HV4-11]
MQCRRNLDRGDHSVAAGDNLPSVSLRLLEDHVGTRKKDKLGELLSFGYPTAKGLILKDGTLTDHNV